MGRRGSERYAIRAFSIPGDPTISQPGTGLSLINTALILLSVLAPRRDEIIPSAQVNQGIGLNWPQSAQSEGVA